MAEFQKKRIKTALPVDFDVYVNIYEKIHENGYEQKCEQSYDPCGFNVRLPYDILRIIFRYLNCKDLSSATMVCRLWSEVANDEKSLRGPQCFTKPRCFIEEKKTFSYIFFELLTIKPSIALFFLPSFTKELRSSSYIRDIIRKTLPKNCKAIILYRFNPVLNERANISQNIVCALFPQISNVEISTVEVMKREVFKRRLIVGLKKYRKMIASFKPDYENSSCLMIFSNDYGSEIARKMVQIAEKRSNNKKISSCWGGSMIKVHTNNERLIINTESYCIALLITGSIKTWSVILHQMETKEQIERKLKLFKEQVNLQKHSVGFIISSDISKWMTEQGETMFKNLFPEVPLVSCFSYSQYGKNIIQGTTTDDYLVPSDAWWSRGSTTIIMILTYG